MKRFIACMAVALMAIMVTSCSVSSYMTSNVNNNVTNVVLQEDNYRIVKHVYAEVSQTYVFGIGGLSPKALHGNAIAELVENAQLEGSQALINVTVKEDLQNVLVWSKRTARATGIVIEFND